MRKTIKLLCFVWLGLFLLELGVSQSVINTEFNVNGCTYIFDGEEVGLYANKCSNGASAGYYYCESGTPPTLWSTMEDGLGCSMGSTDYKIGDDFCCPSGMFCNETGEGLFKCNRRLMNCFEQVDEDACEEAGCAWMDVTKECTDNPRSYDCSYYGNEDDCVADVWGLGTMGVGTETCGSTVKCAGKTFIVPEDGCGCKWYPNAPLGNNCQLNIVVSETFYSGEPNKFECSNVYELGNCTDGSMSVKWDSHSNVISGFEGGIPQECLDEVGCNGGEASRFCGEELIKLPGFSLFGLIMSVGIIGLYYFRHRGDFCL